MSIDCASPGEAFTVDVVQLDGSATAIVRGELDIATAPELFDSLSDKARQLPPGADVVIDIGQLGFIDASGLAGIVRLDNHVRPCGRRVRVESAGPWMRRIFEITGLDGLLRRSESVERVE